MKILFKTQTLEFGCPACSSRAFYKYGRTKTGKQRFICMMCKRQFTQESVRTEFRDRPKCSKCGGRMHLYRRNGEFLWFRCSQYPVCRTYDKKTRQ